MRGAPQQTNSDAMQPHIGCSNQQMPSMPSMLTCVIVRKTRHRGGPVGVDSQQLACGGVVQVLPHKGGDLRRCVVEQGKQGGSG